jgi:hypothetical protein
VPYGNQLRKGGPHSPVEVVEHAALAEQHLLPPAPSYFAAEPFVVLPAIYASMVQQMGETPARAQLSLDAREEALMLVHFCAVVPCANEHTAELRAPAKLNRQRGARGKQPFFSSQVLQLRPDRERPASVPGGGQHASPRLHLRRGHLRRSAWVQTLGIPPVGRGRDATGMCSGEVRGLFTLGGDCLSG